jgi:hypothetical protein
MDSVYLHLFEVGERKVAQKCCLGGNARTRSNIDREADQASCGEVNAVCVYGSLAGQQTECEPAIVSDGPIQDSVLRVGELVICDGYGAVCERSHRVHWRRGQGQDDEQQKS